MERCPENRTPILLVLLLLLMSATPVGAVVNADALLERLYARMERGSFGLGDCTGSLYVKQTVELEKRNWGLDFIPTLTRFDKDEKYYLTEAFYDIRLMEHLLPAMKRKAVVTSHRRGSGEMDIVMGFVVPSLFSKKILRPGFLSPLHRSNCAYYQFSADTLYSGGECHKIDFVQRFDNIKLLRRGWLLLDADCNILALRVEGSDEECSFSAEYEMNGEYKNLLHSVSLHLQYDFAGNKLNVNVDARYSYASVQQMPPLHKRKDRYDLSAAVDTSYVTHSVGDAVQFAAANRPLPLTRGDSVLYERKGVFDVKEEQPLEEDILWSIGDGMISAHSFDWGDGNLKMSPIINPSYLSYSSSRGLSYKMKLKLNNSLGNGRLFSFTPTVGYNFKQETFYWNADARFLFDPLHSGSVSVNAGSDNRTFSSVVLDRIEDSAADSLVFDNLGIRYYKHFYFAAAVKRELLNGLELSVGTKYHRRSIVGHRTEETADARLKDVYRQLAPHVSIVWQPRMYYYVKEGRKVNIGSRMPRLSLDVEHGVGRLFASDGTYTRAEADVQYHLLMGGDARLYLRAGGGGFFYANDVYFADYAFLRENNLPVERNDEIGGVFQLLDSEWYNAAKKYFRLHATYESPFFVVQRLFPKARLVENERLYANVLIMSHLTPYSELGYGIGTPYIDVGFFVSAKELKFHSVGYKITVSLFGD